jgi:hypothetical protein
MATKTKAPQGAHRTLRLVSPHRKGEDIRALQAAVNAEFRHRKLDWREIKVDGEFGNQTLHACAFLGWVLGFSARRLHALRNYQPHISIEVQRLLRNPEKRGSADRAREKSRKPKVQKLRQAHNEGPAAAIAFIREEAARGVHEIGESNTGPEVDKYTAKFGLHAVPWCGCLAGYAAIEYGHCLASGLSFWYGPSLIAEAAARKDGCYPVPFEKIEGGEILVLWRGDHVVTAAAPSKGSTVETGEGNTSPTNGNSQADGGAVAIKTRSKSDVTVAIRIYG